ncbi:MAG: NAD(P)H-dependent oxidoreductase subunit E [Desulfovibrionaceae bacterium]|nr:NAD(P)H-dependent oxidoreductase subunit E [Desulfovibrionaceae bacterium]
MQNSLSSDFISEIVRKHNNDPQQLTAILHDVQEASGQNYVAKEWAGQIAGLLKLPIAHVYEVLTFYSMFSTVPQGRVLIEICNSASCRFNRSQELLGWCREELGIGVGEITPDGEFGIVYTSCVGACDVSPALKIGDDVYGNLDRSKFTQLIASFRENRPELREPLICQS